jgi:zinc protease
MDMMPCSIHGFSGRNTFGISGEFLRDSFADGMELMSTCLLKPAFAAEEVQREKDIFISMINEAGNNARNAAFKNFKQKLFGSHPLSRTIYGTASSLKGLTSGQLVRYHRKKIEIPMVLAVCGGVDTGEVIELGSQLFERKIRSVPVLKPVPWSNTEKPLQVKQFINREQSHVVLGFKGTTLTGRDRYPVDVLLEILGGHGGRLFDEIREKRSLVYDVASLSFEGVEPGFLAFYAATSPGNELAVVDSIKAELKKIIDRTPSKKEVERIKRTMIGSKMISGQRYGARAADMSLGYTYGLGHDASSRYINEVSAVTPAMVQKMAEKYFRFDRMVVSTAGPVDKKLKFW